MGNYTTFFMFENPRRGRQARNFTENDPKTLDLKSSSEQIIVVGCPCGNFEETQVAPRMTATDTNFIASLRMHF